MISAVAEAETPQPGGERRSVRRLLRPETAVAAAVMARAQDAAARLRDGAETRRAVRDHYAQIALALAVEADTVRRHIRLAAIQKGGHHVEELRLVDRTAAQFEIDRHVAGNRSRGAERLDILRAGIDRGGEGAHIGEIAQSLDTAGRRAGTDRDELFRGAPDGLDALPIMRCRDRAFDQRQVVGTADLAAPCLGEVRDFDSVGQGQQFVLAIEDRQLAAVARREFPHCELRPPRRRHV